MCEFPRAEVDPTVSEDELNSIANDLDVVCGLDESCYDQGTGWTGHFAFSAAIMYVSVLNYILLMVGSFWFYPRMIGCCCNLCMGCCHAWSIILAIAYRYGPFG